MVQSVALNGLSSGLPTSSSFAFSTNSFQYLPLESSSSPDPNFAGTDEPKPLPAHIHTYSDVDQQAFPGTDQVAAGHPARPSGLATRQQGLSTDCWLGIRSFARQFLQWCYKTVVPLVLLRYDDFFAYNEEDVLDYDNNDLSWMYARPHTNVTPEAFGTEENLVSKIPQYVIDYAPLVHLYSDEKYWPCDMGEHLHHITPQLNFTPVSASWQHPRLDNLDALNQWDYGHDTFLTSNDNVEDHPAWLTGEKNIPAAPEMSDQKLEHAPLSHKTTKNAEFGRSQAPAVLVVVDKGHGIVDAFWFFFYSFNLGNIVVLRFGNHVGDWEHTLVRFHNGKPKAVFVSEHFFGEAYTYRAMEKVGKRPIVYSATGSHAMYATPGLHSYILPWGLLHDRTDKGPLWDPALNSHVYTYDLRNDTLRSSNLTPSAPTAWFDFAGRWGDKQYPLGDSRQYVFAGNHHYVSGPLGPKFKNLGRRKVCQGRESERCVVKNWLGGTRLRRVQKPFRNDELEEEEQARFSADDGAH